ncbi:hypothetical protein D3C72_151300 [compost metagenome]
MLTFTTQQKQQLRLHAASEILSGHNSAWALLRKGYTTQYEPVFTAHLCSSLSSLATPWRSELRQIDPSAVLSISSAFTHQRPYVTFKDGTDVKQCELSDVMIALIDRSDPSKVLSRCIFVQAKRDDSPTVTLVDPKDLVQLQLYTARPVFDVKRRYAPKNISFPKVLPASPENGLNYGITPPTNIKAKSALSAWGSNRWMLANNLDRHVGTTVAANVPLQDLLVDFLAGDAGFDFQFSSPGDDWSVLDRAGDKWSALINFILQDAVKAASPRYARKYRPFRSDGEQVLHFASHDSDGRSWTFNFDLNRERPTNFLLKETWIAQALNIFDPEPPHNTPPRKDREHDDDSGGGMSVVVMEVSMRNE